MITDWSWGLLTYAAIGLFCLEGCTRSEMKKHGRELSTGAQIWIFFFWPIVLFYATWWKQKVDKDG